jgi:hypothetical protein
MAAARAEVLRAAVDAGIVGGAEDEQATALLFNLDLLMDTVKALQARVANRLRCSSRGRQPPRAVRLADCHVNPAVYPL